MIALARDEVLRRLAVSRETAQKLDWLVAELARWQGAKNLVSTQTLEQVWTRHILDSAQLAAIAPAPGGWMDLGSGGGFPGLVVAIVRTERQLGPVHMVESNSRKCAFLRHVAHSLALHATIHPLRIERLIPDWTEPIATVSARALAPLAQLLAWVHPLLRKGATGIFPKGQDIEIELAEAARSWQFEAALHPSLSDPSGRIAVVRMSIPQGSDHEPH